jgi:hypothetical protein
MIDEGIEEFWQLAAAIRREALEEAAKVAESFADYTGAVTPGSIAEHIRALIDQKPPDDAALTEDQIAMLKGAHDRSPRPAILRTITLPKKPPEAG